MFTYSTVTTPNITTLSKDILKFLFFSYASESDINSKKFKMDKDGYLRKNTDGTVDLLDASSNTCSDIMKDELDFDYNEFIKPSKAYTDYSHDNTLNGGYKTLKLLTGTTIGFMATLASLFAIPVDSGSGQTIQNSSYLDNNITDKSDINTTTVNTTTVQNIPDAIQHKNDAKPKKITLEELSKNTSLAQYINTSESTYFPLSNPKTTITISNDGRKKINSAEITLVKDFCFDTFNPEYSKISIEDDSTFINRLLDYFDSKNISMISKGKDEHDSRQLEMTYNDFLKNEKEIIDILNLTDSSYSDVSHVITDPPKISNNFNIVAYENFHIDDMTQQDKSSKPSIKEIKSKYKNHIDNGLERRRKKEITIDEFIDFKHKINQLHLNELMDNNYSISGIILHDYGIDSINTDWDRYPTYTEKEYNIFKDIFLDNMSSKGYYEYKDNEYIPTEKFNETIKSNPKELLEDVFRTVEEQMEYDYEKLEPIRAWKKNTSAERNFTIGIEHYGAGKDVCGGYAEMIVAAWRTIQESSSSSSSSSEILKKITVFYAMDLEMMNHAWNGLLYENDLTFVDLTWDDNKKNNIPLKKINAMDKKHSLARITN